MPINGELNRGDCVRVDGRVFYVRPNGSSIYLHPTAASCRRASGHTRTIRDYRLLRDGVRVAPHAVAPQVVAPQAVARQRVALQVVAPQAVVRQRVALQVVAPQAVARQRVAPQVVVRRRVAEADIRYLYVVRNCDLPREERDLKIGITSNIATTLRTYRRIQANSQAIIIVDCQGAARPLEQRLHACFDEFRVDQSEVFLLRPHEIRRRLMHYGYRQATDGIWRA